MFEQSLVNGARTTTKWGVLISFAAQSILVAVGALLPLIYTSPLPMRQWMSRVIAPIPRGAEPRVTRAEHMRPAARPRPEQAVLTAPSVIPRNIALIHDSDTVAPPEIANGPGIPGVLPGVGSGPVPVDLLSTPKPVAPPPEVDQPKPPAPKRRVEIGGDVQRAKQVYAPMPQYPPLARQARVSGLVRLSAIIAEDGTIDELRVIGGHPLLVSAAMEAVSKWRYRPTLLNGRPVQVITQIDVNFTLNR